jgi:hypothetical protein
MHITKMTRESYNKNISIQSVKIYVHTLSIYESTNGTVFDHRFLAHYMALEYIGKTYRSYYKARLF